MLLSLNPKVRALATSLLLVLGAAHPAHAQPAPAAEKVFRYAYPIAETGFDPAQISDLYSAIVQANIFDAPYALRGLGRSSSVYGRVAVPSKTKSLP